MENQPLVSVIIPTHNRSNYIGKAVKSVLDQTYKNTEIIIIDDGSIDRTPEVISELSREDSRIFALRNKTNLGIARSLNKGIRKAQGKYIARLDDDDFWLDPKKLEKQVKFLESHPEYVLVGGGMVKIDSDGKEIKRYLFPENDEDIRKSLLVYNLFVQSTVLFRKNAWKEAGGYDEELNSLGEDRDLWLKMGKVGKFYNFQEFFTCYLDEKGHNIGARKRNARRLRTQIRLRSKYRNDYPGILKSIFFCLVNYLVSFLPFSEDLHPIFLELRKIFFGSPPYIYFKKENNKESKV